MTSRIFGAVLAGGSGRRLGRDKALVEIGGRPLVARAFDLLSRELDEVVVVGRAAGQLGGLELPAIADRRPGQGPLGGLETALAEAGGRPVFVLACDLARVTAPAVAWLVGRAGRRAAEAGRARAWVPSLAGRVQPLCAVYSPGCRAVAAARLERGERAMMGLLDAIGAEILPLTPRLAFFRPDLLDNLNRPADLAAAARGDGD